MIMLCFLYQMVNAKTGLRIFVQVSFSTESTVITQPVQFNHSRKLQREA